MALIDRDGKVVTDTFQLVADDAAVPASGDVIVGLKRFLSGEVAGRSGKVGVRVDPEDDLTQLVPELAKVAAVAISFPKFGDGRGYTKARLLRERYGFQGEVRAVGEVLADQLFFMRRCGFDRYALAPGKSVEAAIAALADFSVTYQAAADEARPLYRRVTR